MINCITENKSCLNRIKNANYVTMQFLRCNNAIYYLFESNNHTLKIFTLTINIWLFKM